MLLVVWLGVIFVVSVIPVSQPKTELPMDKLEHAVAYGITAILFFRVLIQRRNLYRTYVCSVLAASVYGAGIECVQYFLPYRSFSTADIAANFFGALIFCLPYAVWRKS